MKRIISLLSVLCLVSVYMPVYADTVNNTEDITVTVTYKPEKYIYFHNKSYVVNSPKMLVDTSSGYSAYSTNAYLAYDVHNSDAIEMAEFSVFCNYITDNTSQRSGNTFYSRIDGSIADIAAGTYEQDSEKYKEWKTYFTSYTDKTKLWRFNTASYPELKLKNQYDENGCLKTEKIYSGWLERELPESVVAELKNSSDENKSTVFTLWALGGGNNVQPDIKISELKVTYDVSKVSNQSEENVMNIINSTENADEIKSCIKYFGSTLKIDENIIYDINGICGDLSEDIKIGTVFTADSFKEAYNNFAAEYIISENGTEIDTTSLTVEEFINEANNFSGTTDDFLNLINKYAYAAEISKEYINDFNLLSESEKSEVINTFLSEADADKNINDLFYTNLTKVYSGSQYADEVKFSNDFESNWRFFKYFLNQLDLSEAKMETVKSLYDTGKYEEAVKEYRNIVLDEMRITDLGTLSYHDNSYQNRAWAEFFAGVNNNYPTTGGYAVLRNCNLQGSPYKKLTPNWTYSVKFPDQAHTSDISYFTCFNPLAAKYFETEDVLYLDKWMQIANIFCTEHRRWYNENYGADDYHTNCCWHYKNAQSALNQADRTSNIIRVLAIFAKLADDKDKPISWANVLEARGKISDVSLYDSIDPVIFSNIVMSLIYDHSEALSLRYENYGSVPNQRFSGLKALATVDRFFADSKKYKTVYSESTANGLKSYASESYYPDGGMAEQAFNYNSGELNSVKDIYNIFASKGEEIPEYINLLCDNAEKAEKMHNAIVFPNGVTPTVGMGGASAVFSEKNYTSIAFPYIGFYAMRNSWEKDGTNLFMQTPRRTGGHLYPSNNGIELYAKGRLLLMNGGAPWYAKNMAPADQAAEFDRYNEYFGESSSYNRNTVIIDNKSQNKTEFNGVTGNPALFNYTLNNLWHTSDTFDYLSSDYDGGYGSDKASTVHNRAVTYIKDIDMFIVADTVRNNEEEIKSCSQIWNFMPYLEKAADGVDAGGFTEDEVTFDSENRYIKTADEDGANVFLYNFYPEELEYTKYYGYKGEDGYKGFYGPGVGSRRYPKVDMHVEWQEKGKSIPLLTLIETSDNTESQITSFEDLSYSDESGGYSGFKISVGEKNIYCYFSDYKRLFTFNDFVLTAKSVVYEEGMGKIIVTGADGYVYENFEGTVENGVITPLTEIGVPSGFAWTSEETPDYSQNQTAPIVENVTVTGNACFAGTLKMDYDFVDSKGGEDASMIQWYYSEDCKNWKLVSGARGREYTIEYYNSSRTSYYYMAAVKPKTSDGRIGQIVYSEPTTICAYVYNDFENGNLGEVYNVGTYVDDQKNHTTVKEIKEESGNKYIRLKYSGKGRSIQASSPYIRRFWKNFDELVSYKMRVRFGGECVRVCVTFGTVLETVSKANGYSEDTWYDITCIVNPTEREIDGMPAMSYYLSYRADGDDEWTDKELKYFTGDQCSNVLNNGKDNRSYIYFGSNEKALEEYVDIDDMAALPVVWVKGITRNTAYNDYGDEVNYSVGLKNNDTLSKRARTMAVCAYENGRLVNVKTERIIINPNEERTVNVTLDAPKQEQDREVKCLILDNLDNLKPVYNHITGFDYK
ncbi:MAG: heparinase II/III family protein [Clostridia bacterium]|nr:heparinase II/III family protein [Clostridia bacterium]